MDLVQIFMDSMQSVNNFVKTVKDLKFFNIAKIVHIGVY